MAAQLVRRAGSRTLTGELVTADPADRSQTALTLAPGTRLAVEVDPQKWCLGYRSADHGDVPCPDSAPVQTGRMCAKCQAADPWRWMHIVHRSQFLDPRLREHMMRPHWLYVATFAGGAHKVGTAVDDRKRARLDEQGAILASWVALAGDGLVVRELEDRVSAELSARIGLGQVVRPSVKAAGLSNTVDLPALTAQHNDAVRQARDVLDALPETLSLLESWPNPRDCSTLEGLSLRGYPGHLGSGRHGFTVDACWGPVALVRLDGDPVSHYAVDLSRLVGHKITTGDFSTEAPEQQDSLF